MTKERPSYIPGLSMLMAVLLLGGCGGGASSSVAEESANSIASRGLITGFGSVYVNGIRYRTDATRFSVDDDDNGGEADLRVGMIVTVRGSVDDDRRGGQASSITYDNELKGPVASVTQDPADATLKTLVILGQSVVINSATTIDDDLGLTFDNIQPGNVLEVSGFVTDSGLIATHIELQENALEIEIRGIIASLDANSFTINGFPVSYDDMTELDDIALLVDGLFVEVEGQLNGAGTILIAEEIEREQQGLDDDLDEAEVEGVITNYDPANQTFVIQGQAVDASTAVLFPASLVLADGVIVEAEGRIVNAVLLAEEVEQKGKEIEIHATLTAVGSDSVSFTFNGTDIVARVNRQTEIEDEINDTDLVLSQLSPGDFVELEAFSDGSGVINAVEIERRSPDEVRIAAAVESWNESAQSVVLLGASFDLSAASYENDSEQNISAAAFYAALEVGEFIEIRDSDSNGVFDKAELDD